MYDQLTKKYAKLYKETLVFKKEESKPRRYGHEMILAQQQNICAGLHKLTKVSLYDSDHRFKTKIIRLFNNAIEQKELDKSEKQVTALIQKHIAPNN